MNVFRLRQDKHMDRLLQGYTAAYTLAVQVREDIKITLQEWISTSRGFREDEAEKALTVWLKVGAGVVAGALSLATAGTSLAVMGLLAASAAVTAGVEAYSAPLGGAKKEDVLASLERTLGRLEEECRTGVDQIRVFATKYVQQEIDGQKDLLPPLPSTTDVDSPDFRYENFHHDLQPPGFDERVNRQREKYVAEKSGSGDSVIARRLGAEDAE